MRVVLWALLAISGFLMAVAFSGPQDFVNKVLPAAQAQQSPVILHVRDAGTGSTAGTCQTDGQVVMRVSVEAAQGVAALSFELVFNQAVATVPSNGVSASAELPNGWLFVPNPNTPGRLVIGMIGTTTPSSDSFTIADVTFNCGGSPGQTTNLTFSGIVAGDADTVELPAQGVGGSIQISGLETTPLPTATPPPATAVPPTATPPPTAVVTLTATPPPPTAIPSPTTPPATTTPPIQVVPQATPAPPATAAPPVTAVAPTTTAAAPTPIPISEIKALVSVEQTTVIETIDREIAVTVPPQALPAGLDAASVEIAVTVLVPESVPQPVAEVSLVRVFELETLINGQITEVIYDKEIELSFPMSQEDIDRVDGDTSRLVVLRFNSAASLWEFIEFTYDSSPPPAGRLIAKRKSFSLYAVGVREQKTNITAVPATPQQPEPPATLTPTPTTALAATPPPAATPVPIATSPPATTLTPAATPLPDATEAPSDQRPSIDENDRNEWLFLIIGAIVTVVVLLAIIFEFMRRSRDSFQIGG